MKLREWTFTICCGILIVFLLILNIGLTISGPANYEKEKERKVFVEVKKEYPFISKLERHSFRYVTYHAIYDQKVYLFDYEGGLVMIKDYDEDKLNKVKNIVEREYGIENADVKIGYGKENMIYYVETENQLIQFDYNRLEVVYYVRSDLLETVV